MCIIAIKPEGKELFLESTIRTMFNKNPDGAGFMFFNKKTNKVEAHKGFFKCEDIINALKNIEGLKDTNAVLHFRIGTSGLMDDLNCHPYPVYEENRDEFETDLAMVHNGILREYTPSFESKINDTQTFIQTVLRKLSPDFINDPEKLFLINQLIGTNKLAFLDKNNHITMLGDFIEDSGYYYSNGGYKEPEWKTFYQSSLWSSSYLDSLSSFKDDFKDDEDDEELEEDEIEFESLEEMMDYLDEFDRIGSTYYDGKYCYIPDFTDYKVQIIED